MINDDTCLSLITVLHRVQSELCNILPFLLPRSLPSCFPKGH